MSRCEIDMVAEYRALIDLVATTRARCIRVALFGTQLHRPDPDGEETDEDRASQLAVLIDTVNWIERVSVLLTGTDPWGKIPQAACDRIGGFAASHPTMVQRFAEMHEYSRRVANAAEADNGELGAALRAHYEVRRAGFMDLVTEFCDGMWAHSDEERRVDVARATEAGQTIGHTLTRLEAIGKHVRLVSLNASVEAARVGDAGRGLGVIASEFKKLAEEIQALSVNARDDISALTGERETPRATQAQASAPSMQTKSELA